MEFYYQWFNDYIEVFLNCEDPKVRVNYELKKEHTFRVKDNILKIGKALNLDEHKLMLCEIIGLFHDVGRFKQYSEYGTFSENITGSHGKLSVDVLIEHNVLKALSDSEKDIILKAIDYHNYFLVPEDESDTIKFFSRLIRDADKLDAFYLETDTTEERKYDLGTLSSEKEYSDEVINDLMASRQVDFSNFKYTYDRKLGILGLIYDLYYGESFQVFKSENYLQRLFNQLPKNVEMEKVFSHCNNYIDSRIKKV